MCSAAVEAAAERRTLVAFPGHTAKSLGIQSTEFAVEGHYHTLHSSDRRGVGQRNLSAGTVAQWAEFEEAVRQIRNLHSFPGILVELPKKVVAVAAARVLVLACGFAGH